MEYRNLLIILTISIVVVLLLPPAVDIYKQVTGTGAEDVKVDVAIQKISKIDNNNSECVFKVSGTIDIDYDGELNEIRLISTIEGKPDVTSDQPKIEIYESAEEILSNPKGVENFNITNEISRKCSSLVDPKVKVVSIKKKYF